MSDIKPPDTAVELKEHDGFLPVDARAARLQAAMLLSEAMADLAAVLRADAESDESVASLAPISPPPPPPPPPPGVVSSAER